MKLTKLSAAPEHGRPAWLPLRCRLMPAPARMDAGTASQLIPGVRPTNGGTWRTSVASSAQLSEASTATLATGRDEHPQPAGNGPISPAGLGRPVLPGGRAWQDRLFLGKIGEDTGSAQELAEPRLPR